MAQSCRWVDRLFVYVDVFVTDSSSLLLRTGKRLVQCGALQQEPNHVLLNQYLPGQVRQFSICYSSQHRYRIFHPINRLNRVLWRIQTVRSTCLACAWLAWDRLR